MDNIIIIFRVKSETLNSENGHVVIDYSEMDIFVSVYVGFKG